MQPVQDTVALSIAGFDPSGGAGVLADVKTFEQVGVYGFGIATSITYQSDIRFDGVKWLSFDEIEAQFKPLAARFHISYVKIGLVQNAGMLKSIIDMLHAHNPEVKIIWDPVLKTSTGYLIHGNAILDELEEITRGLYLVTPNTIEAETMHIENFKSNCNILIKGGHSSGDTADILYTKDSVREFGGERIPGLEKHGSGCVLSAAITAFLSKGFDLDTSIIFAKEYTLAFLQSAEGLLGFHHKIEANAFELPY